MWVLPAPGNCHQNDLMLVRFPLPAAGDDVLVIARAEARRPAAASATGLL
jgi:hypothetical protein